MLAAAARRQIQRRRRAALLIAMVVFLLQLTAIGGSPADAAAIFPGSVSTGGEFSCGVTTAGAAKCWGYNGWGNLGDNSYANSNVPVQVSGLTTGVLAVSVGTMSACALKTDGSLWCWGYGYDGLLGNNSNSSSPTPVQVQGFDGISLDAVAVSVGAGYACAVTSGGAVRCWGSNPYGQLGDGTTTTRKVPTQVTGLTSGATDVAAGVWYSCAVVSGAARCWGTGFTGGLGYGGVQTKYTPVQVKYLTSGVTDIAVGYGHTCAIASGALSCWGYNSYGQVGDGTSRQRLVPVQVQGLSTGVTAVDAGNDVSCAVKAGSARCWGSNSTGALGDGTTIDRKQPTQVSGLGGGVTAVDTSGGHSCALLTSGSVRCWGSRSSGRLGDGVTQYRSSPVQVSGLTTGVTSLAGGASHACALVNGGVRCWGSNGSGQIGDGTYLTRSTPTAVVGLSSGVVSLVSTASSSCALKADGAVWCWGDGYSGQLGDGSSDAAYEPVQPVGLPTTAALGAGDGHVCAVDLDGAVWCWGNNSYGQLGDGTTDDSFIPLEVPDIAPAVAVVGGDYHTCAVLASGTMECWGRNFYGQIGDGSTTDRPAPSPVSQVSGGTTSIAAGSDHTCAVVASAVACWGSDGSGQLGSGNGGYSTEPLAVGAISAGATSVAADGNHSCAVVAGAAKCWGQNWLGQIGDGTVVDRSLPVQVAGLASGVTAVAAGRQFSCAVASGAAWCWGQGESGQLGIGDSVFQQLTPVAVSGWVYVSNPPTAVTVTTSTTAASVAFTPDPDDGGSAVTSFTATCASSDGGTTRSATGASSPVTVSSLTTGKIYTCTVIATNGVGDSEPSVASGPFIPAAAPTITSFTPTSGNKGTSVTITGTNFAPGATCRFTNNITASVCAFISTTTLVTSVPTGATTGKITVITAAGTAQSTTNISVGTSLTAPVVTTFTPNAGIPGDLVTINGTNLAGATAVKIGTVTVNSGWTVLSAGQIRVPVPAGASTGTVSVTTVGGIATTTTNFTVYVSPAISSFTPTTQRAGLPVTITGTGLLGTSSVSFNGTTATPTSISATSLSVVVPRGVTTGKITVTNPAGSATSGANFTPIRYVATQLTAGTSHSCARVSDGTVQCWGANGSGQLGDNTTTTPRSLSVQVRDTASTFLTGVASVAAGGAFTCAVFNPGAAGTARCWGANGSGQLGNATTSTVATSLPVTVKTGGSTLTGVSSIAAGFAHACALMNDQRVYCWGANASGQLGVGSSSATPTTQAVKVLGPGSASELTGVTQIAAGGTSTTVATTCALTSDGAVYCWGSDSTGQLGDDTTIASKSRPVPVQGLGSGVAQIAVGGNHACATLSTGEVKCWGSNLNKQLGDGTQVQRSTPVSVSTALGVPLGGVTSVAAGAAFTCALLTDTVRCWGLSTNGQLGLDSTVAQTYLGGSVLGVSSGTLSGVTAIAAGGTHMLALSASDAYDGVSWGSNASGQLGDNTTIQRNRPVYILGF